MPHPYPIREIARQAYLINQWLGGRDSRVLVALSRTVFRGEEEREIGFRSAIRKRWPHRALTEITDSDGLDTSVYRLTLGVLDRPQLQHELSSYVSSPSGHRSQCGGSVVWLPSDSLAML